MKKILGVALAILLLLPVGAAYGAGEFERVWSLTDTCAANGSNGTYIGMVGVAPLSNTFPVVESLNVTSDLASSALTFYSQNGDSTTVDASSAAAQKILSVAATADFDGTAGVGSFVMVVDPYAKTMEVNRISSLTAGASMAMVENLANTYGTNTTVYELGSLGGPPVGNATKDWAEFTAYGEVGEGLGLVVTGTSSCSINYAAGGRLNR